MFHVFRIISVHLREDGTIILSIVLGVCILVYMEHQRMEKIQNENRESVTYKVLAPVTSVHHPNSTSQILRYFQKSSTLWESKHIKYEIMGEGLPDSTHNTCVKKLEGAMLKKN